ncbi:MAG: FG-GAP-like repeat-containing protein [Bacteroidota bacterium]
MKIFIFLFITAVCICQSQLSIAKANTHLTGTQDNGVDDTTQGNITKPARPVIAKKDAGGLPKPDSLKITEAQKHAALGTDNYTDMNCDPEWKYATLGKYIGTRKMQTLDIDNDGITEIVAGTSFYWYIMKYDAVKDTVDFLWISNISDEYHGLNYIGVFDINNDSISDIFVGHSNGIIELFDGLTRTLKMELPTINGLDMIRDIEYADADNDGVKELVIGDLSKIYIVNTDGYYLEQVIPYADYDFEIGNVDADSSLEIVTSHGKVLQLNGTNLVEEWIYSTANHRSEYLVHLSDIDNDGMKEILRSKDNVLEIYDADTKLMKHQINETADIMQFIMKDIDNNGSEEIVYGLLYGGLRCYDASTYQQIWTMQNYNTGVDALNIYDVDGDGALDVIWSSGSGVSNNYYHEFFIADMASHALKCRSLPVAEYLDKIGVGDIDNDGTKELVVYEGNLMVFDGVTHGLKCFLTSGYLISLGLNAVSFKIDDIDKDGIEEIVFYGGYYDVAFWYMNGITKTIKKSHVFSSSGMANCRYIDIDDVDNDGVKEIIATTPYKYYIINSENFEIDYASDNVFQNNYTPVRVGNIDNDDQSEIITGKGILKIFDSQTHVSQEINWKEFTVSDVYDMDGDGMKDIIAGTYDGYVYVIDGVTLLKMSAIKLSPSAITAITVSDLNNDLKPEIIATSYGKVIIYSDSTHPIYVKNLDPSGFNLGGLVVNDINKDGQYDLIYGGRYQVEQLASNCYHCMWLDADKAIEKTSCGAVSDGSVFIMPKGGKAPYSFSWNNGSTANPLNNLSPGTYIVTLTDNNGCVLIDTSVIQQAVLAATYASVNETCNPGDDGSATVSISEGTEPITYLWNTGSNTASINNQAKGSYSVIVRDSKNCELNKTLVIQKDTLILQVTKKDISCYGNNNGIILINPTTGKPPYTFSWNSGQNSAQLSGLVPGIYAVDVTDSHGCYAHDTRTITEPELLTSSMQSTPDTNTNQFGDGIATAIVTGGTPPYTYRWNDPFAQTTATAYNLFHGKYTVIINDARWCQVIDTVSVAETNSVSDNYDPVKLSVYPNPTSGKISLDVHFDEMQNMQVDIYDQLGRKVYTALYPDVFHASLPIDLSAFVPGAYSLIIKTNTGYAMRKVQLVK